MPIVTLGNQNLVAGTRKPIESGTRSHQEATRAAAAAAAKPAGHSVQVAPTVMASIALDFKDAQPYEETQDLERAKAEALRVAAVEGVVGDAFAELVARPAETFAAPPRIFLMKRMPEKLHLNGTWYAAQDWFGRSEDEQKEVVACTAAEFSARFKKVSAAKSKPSAEPETAVAGPAPMPAKESATT